MKTVKIGSKDENTISTLCELLGVEKRSSFDEEIKSEVINFQRDHNLDADGIVGPKTWFELFISYRLKNDNSRDILDSDYDWAGKYLDCEPESLKAVVKVETGGRDGFISPGKPIILFEGHIFWKQLKQRGIDPVKYSKSFPNIVYEKWTKKYYLGGAREYERFEQACSISESAAISSTSFGIFQIMGFNYKLCSCNTPEIFYSRMCESEFIQFTLGLEFIRNQKLNKYLAEKNWDSFAYKYNGPGYKENKYDTKLQKAYIEFKK